MENRDDLVKEQSELIGDKKESIEILQHRKLEESSDFKETVSQESIEEGNEEVRETIFQETTPQEIHAKSSDELIDEARSMVHESDSVVKDCMSILDDDINAFDSKKSKLLHGNVQRIESLLDEVGFEPEEMEVTDVDSSKFGGDNVVQPMYVRSLSSGKLSSFILALIFGIASIAGWVYVASKKLGLALDLSTKPTEEVQTQILSWIGGGITGGEGNPLVGMAILGLTAIVVIWIVYALRVSMRASKNLKIAQQVNKDAKFYCTKKEECKKELGKVSNHIHDIMKVLDTYDILFEEQSSKIKRIIHIEGKLPFHEYHQKSKDEMNEVGRLANSLNTLLATPMADEVDGSLSRESKEALTEAINAQKVFVDKLYQ